MRISYLIVFTSLIKNIVLFVSGGMTDALIVCGNGDFFLIKPWSNT